MTVWLGLGRFVLWSVLICGTALGLLRLGTWAMGSATLHADVKGPPQIVTWQVADPAFGGLSALIMAPDGMDLVAGGDHGALVEAQLTRASTGEITAIKATGVQQAQLRSGNAPTDFKMDLEAMTRDPEGGWFLAYESFVRIERLAHVRARPVATHSWEKFVPIFGNLAFEALATLPGARVIAISEAKEPNGKAGSIIWNRAKWRAGPQIPVSPGYRITGADVGPDGCLYLVERRYSLAGGFRFGVRRLSGGPDTWEDTLLYQSAPARLGNAEAISAWQDAAGQIVLTLITDDGFLPLTATRVIELRSAPGTGCTIDF